jgi:hypothetical protein
MNAEHQFLDLLERQEKIATSELDAFYAALEPVAEAFMLGEWTGGMFFTGHVAEGMLSQMQWVGKHFHHRDLVDPIVCTTEGGSRKANDVMGRASLREVVYRGELTATMVYDKHPIFDHFKKINEKTVFGIMDRKGEAVPAYFYLQRL